MDTDDFDHERSASAPWRGDSILRDAQRIAGIGSWEWDILQDRLRWSESLFRITGVDPARFSGAYADFQALVHPDDAARVLAACSARRRRADGDAIDMEYRIVRPGGEIRILHERGEVRFDAAGAATFAAGVVMDVTERRLAEFALARTSRALQMLSRCNEAVVRAQGEAPLLAEVCRIAVDDGGYRMASVLYVQDDAALSLVPVAHAGHEAGYFSEIDLSWSADVATGQGPAGRAVRGGCPVVSADVSVDPDYAPWAQRALQRGYRSVVSLPLKSGGRVFGVFGLYSGEIRSIAPNEVELLVKLADDLAFGIASLRARAERQVLIDAAAAISDSASGSVGEVYFERLLKSLLACLGADAGVIAGMAPAGQMEIQALCAVVDQEVVPNFRYAAPGTPCEDVVDGGELVIERDVCRLYPAAPGLAQLGAQAYVGKNLVEPSGRRIGTIFVLYREPLRQRALAVAMLRLVAARVTAEIARQRDESQLRDQARLLDAAQDAILVRTVEGRITYWNQGAQRLYGWTAAEVHGRSVLDLEISDPAQYRAAMETVLSRGECIGEIDQRTKDGRAITVEGRWTLVRDADGNPNSVLAINTDITERKAAEARLAESEARAAHAQKLESIGQLTGGIAHDFNNLLTVIIGNSDQLEEELREQPRLAQLAAMVRVAGERGAELTSRLLAFARRQALEPKLIEPPRIVADMRALLRRTLGDQIEIQTVTDPGTWTVNIDPGQLEMAILNLCINARDAMPHGGKLMIETANVRLGQEYAEVDFEVEPGAYVMIAITDTGDGIPAEHIERVFDPFFTTKPTGKGTGLGLSMVYGFTKQSGGNVKIYSEPGVGTAVKLYLPRASIDAEVAGAADATAAHPAARGIEVILLVEDDELVRNHAMRMLDDLGYRVIAAADGPAALEIARGDQRIDLLFTDVTMPGGMSGPMLAARVLELRPRLPVLYTSGYTENAIVHHGRVDAGTQLLHKPYDRRALAEKIRDSLGWDREP